MISIKEKAKTKYQVGDRFVVTVAEVFEGAESKSPIYRIQGFDSLTFNDRGLDKLKKLPDEQEQEKDDLNRLARAFSKGYYCGERETKEALKFAKEKERLERYLKLYCEQD